MKYEIKIYGPIDSYWNGAEEIIGGIPENATDITVRIHSPGGSVWEGVAIYNALRDHKAKITTIIEGYAASIASVIMLAGDVRKIHKSSMVMIHNPWTYSEGNADELRKVADNLDVCADAIVGIYADRTQMSIDEITDLMESESYFLGEVATDRGFATELIDDVEAENKIAAMLRMDKLVAKTEGNGVMSKIKTRKEIEATLAEITAKHEAQVVELAALKESGDNAIAELKAEHVTAIDAKDSEIAKANAETKTAQAKVAELEADAVESVKAFAELKAKFEEAKATSDTQASELAKAKAALENPAVADAILADAENLAKAQADAAADEAEAKAAAKLAKEAPKNIVEEYERIEDIDARRAFLKENNRAIMACYASLHKEGK